MLSSPTTAEMMFFPVFRLGNNECLTDRLDSDSVDKADFFFVWFINHIIEFCWWGVERLHSFGRAKPFCESLHYCSKFDRCSMEWWKRKTCFLFRFAFYGLRAIGLLLLMNTVLRLFSTSCWVGHDVTFPFGQSLLVPQILSKLKPMFICWFMPSQIFARLAMPRQTVVSSGLCWKTIANA